MHMKYLFAGAAALALSACGNQAADQPAAAASSDAMAEPAASDAMAGAPSAAPAMAMTGQAFADTAAASDMFEVESSKLAQQKAKNADVKAFAAMMVKDHTKSTADLKAAAGKASPAVTVAPKLTPEQEADLATLRSAADADFDRTYAEKQVAAHEKTLAALQSYAQGGDVPALKDFAAKTAPVVSHHLEQARNLPK